jgi:dTDP-4-dehydrorhamnose reductase
VKLDSNSRIYIAGCGGMLGEAVHEYFSERTTVKSTDIDVNTKWLEYADVRDFRNVFASVQEFKPDIIINLAALTDLEYCERNPNDAWLTNALGGENLALIADKMNAIYVYISTAGIFGGEKEVYNDFDEANPLSMYAKSKYYGEEFTKKYLRRYFVFRAGWMMGGGPKKDKKFINKIYKQIAGGSTTLSVVDDKLGTPTYTKSFAEGMFKVIETELYGLYNQVCGGECSRYDVALEFVRLLGMDAKVAVKKVGSDFFSKEYFAPRPRSEKLINMKLNSRGINYMPDWKVALEDYSKVFKEDMARCALRF